MMNSQANAIQSLDVNLAVGIENSHTVDSSRLSIAISDIKKAIKLEPTNQNALRLYKELKLNSKRQAKQKSELENGEFLLVSTYFYLCPKIFK